MNYISSSHEIFFLVFSFCALWVTVLLSFLLYYIISSVRELHQVMRQAKAKLDAVDDVINVVKDSIGSGVSYLGMLFSGLGKITDLLGSGNKPAKKSKRS